MQGQSAQDNIRENAKRIRAQLWAVKKNSCKDKPAQPLQISNGPFFVSIIEVFWTELA